MSNIEYDDYMFLKLSQLVMIESDFEEVLAQVPRIFSIEFLHDFSIIIEQYCNACYVGGEIKDNVLKYVNKFRFMKFEDEMEEDRHIITNLVNQIIVNINKQSFDFNLQFYRDEMYKKTFDEKFLVASSDYVYAYKPVLSDFVKYDCAFLYTHSEHISDELFKKQYVPMLIDNQSYFQSLNSVLNDAPHLFLNPSFKNRVLLILNEDYQKLDNKNLKKDIKLLTRKIKRGI